MLTGRPAQRLVDHNLLASTSVVLVPPLAVPDSLVAVPDSLVAVPASLLPVPASPVPVPPSPVALPLSPMVATPSSPIVAVPSSPGPVPASEPRAMTLNVAPTRGSSTLNTSDPAQPAVGPVTLPATT